MDQDSELLKRGRSDPKAFRALIERHGPYLYGIAHSLSGNATDAEDLVQETLLGAIRSEFRGESSVRTWLVRILSNQAAMLRRTRKRRPEKELTIEQAPASRRDAGSAVDAKVDLGGMLEQLSVEHRQVIVLRELDGLSYEEIAEALQLPRGTVESRLHRAREELRKRFKGY